VRYARTSRGYNQTDFAAKVGVDQSTISALESGRAPISEKSLERVAVGLDTTVRVLLQEWLDGTGDADDLPATDVPGRLVGPHEDP
jgi:transcriptional regulator with XRE-family HTH domain